MFSKKMLEHIGDLSQIGGIKRTTCLSGKAKGVELLDVNNGNGLLFTVVADRGLDIANLSFKGIPVAFISKTGIVSPEFYNEKGDEWLRSFTGGFLTTCGLTQVGDPCEYEGISYGLHGPYSNLPAEQVSTVSSWNDDQYTMKITGEIRQAKVQYENLLLKRTITAVLGKNEILIEDEITNEGWRTEPFMILYHMNFGYPFLNPETQVVIPTRKIDGWDVFSGENLDRHLEITEPAVDSPELTYRHDVGCEDDGQTKFMMVNSTTSPEIAVVIEYSKKELNILTQWKYLRKGEYVMALEPCNNLVKGVEYESLHGDLKYIQPGETKHIKIKAAFLTAKTEIENEIVEIRRLKMK